MEHNCPDGQRYEWEARTEHPVACPRCKCRLDYPRAVGCPSCGGSGEVRRRRRDRRHVTGQYPSTTTVPVRMSPC